MVINIDRFYNSCDNRQAAKRHGSEYDDCHLNSTISIRYFERSTLMERCKKN